MDECAYWLWLVMVFGPANPRIWLLSRNFDTVDRFVSALEDGKVRGISGGERERISQYEVMDAALIVDEYRSAGYGVFCYDSDDYPEKLRGIPNPPAVVFVKGDIDILSSGLIVNVAGTRSPIPYSVKVTQWLCTDLANRGCIIASGLSDGIDVRANDAAITAGRPTVGVCGLAIDMYEDDPFIDKITENGLIISETCAKLDYPRPRFADRNRLLVALCDAMVFVEGSTSSRGLNMCEQANAQGKFLFVVPPHDITDQRYGGQAWLIRRGCKPVLSAEDILFCLAHMNVEMLEYEGVGEAYTEPEDYSFFSSESPSQETKSNKKKKTASEDNTRTDTSEETAPDLSELDELESSIYELLRREPLLADVIAAKLEADIADVLSKLTMLEVEGFIVSLPGKRYGVK